MNLELRIKKNIIHQSSIISHKSLLGFIKHQLRRSGAGFTLIELLVVIIIIGVLSAILFANFVGVRQRARDAQRKSDLRQIQAALELYKADIGNYPASVADRLPSSAGCPTSGSLESGGVTYMQKIPCNPKSIGGTYSPLPGDYVYSSTDPKKYNLVICLENKNDMGSDTVPITSTGLCSGAPSRAYYLKQP